MRFYEFNPSSPQLLEVNMSPSALRTWMSSPAASGMQMGFEFELCTKIPDSIIKQMPTPDSIDAICDFFSTSTEQREYAYDLLHYHYHTWATDLFFSHTEDDDEYADKLNERIAEILIDKYSEQEAEEMTADRSSEWDAAYDKAEAEFEHEFMSYGEGSEETWLIQVMNIHNMVDAASLELSTQYAFEMPDQYDPVPGVIDSFKKAIGVSKVEYNSKYHGVERTGSASYSNWIVETDASIDPESTDFGLEFISPVQSLDKAIADLQSFIKWANSYGCYTNSSTGLHINVSIPNYSRESLDYIKLALFSGDDYILNQFGRTYNKFCQGSLKSLKANPEKLSGKDQPDNIGILEKMKQGISAEVSQLFHDSFTDKHVSINAKAKWVEFRGPGDDYLNKDANFLASTAIRVAMALNIACNDKLYKQEYAKKLYKLAAPGTPATSIDSFVKYATNVIDKTQLKSTLQAKRVPPTKTGETTAVEVPESLD